MGRREGVWPGLGLGFCSDSKIDILYVPPCHTYICSIKQNEQICSYIYVFKSPHVVQ